jgi:N-acetyl sugar amidotransferase
MSLAPRGYRICRRCIMDTSDPGIFFDEMGVCRYCHTYDDRVRSEVFCGADAAKRLQALAEKMKRASKGHTYDCLIGVSGGADSSMALWTLRNLGLRVLAIHLDNGWNSELAVSNIQKIIEGLGVDLHTHVIDWDEFRDLQLAFLKASVPNAEIPTDHALVALHFSVAAKHGIKYIINGGNVSTEAFMPDAWAYNARDLRHLRAIHRRFGTGRTRSLPTLGIPASLYYVFCRGIRWITVLNYVGYRKPEAIAKLRETFDWRPYGGKHYESVYTRFFQGYILPTKFGFDKRRAHLSNLVLSGDLARDEALAQMEEDEYLTSGLCTEDRRFVLKKLGLSESEFEALMNLPPRSHYEYPNHRMVFERMPRAYGLLKRFAMRP